MRHRDDWRPRIQGTNEEFSFCDEYDFCLSVSRSLFDTNARWIIIFHRGSLAVVSLDHLFLIIFWRTMLFLIPRFEKTRNASSRKNEDVSFSLPLSVCLSLSRARRGKEEQTTRNKSHHRTKKGTDEKASPQSSSHSRSKKSNRQIRASFETRKEEEEDTRERVLSLLRAVLRIKEIERCDFWFLPFVCVCVCVS